MYAVVLNTKTAAFLLAYKIIGSMLIVYVVIILPSVIAENEHKPNRIKKCNSLILEIYSLQ